MHRLTDRGAVITHAATATSRDGFEAEWRMIDVFTVEGDLFNRCEIFDEADLDAALARFDELSRRRGAWKTRQAKCSNASGRISAARDWDAMAEMLADNYAVTIAVAWWARESAMVETLRSRTCRRSPTCGTRT